MNAKRPSETTDRRSSCESIASSSTVILQSQVTLLAGGEEGEEREGRGVR